MHLEPLASDYTMLSDSSDAQRLDYFLLRAFEADEIWGLREGSHWFSRVVPEVGQRALPLWPYRKMARDAALDIWQDCRVDGTALEYFLQHEMPKLIAEEVLIDIIPRDDQPGCLIPPTQLASIIEGMMDAGEYRLDG